MARKPPSVLAVQIALLFLGLWVALGSAVPAAAREEPAVRVPGTLVLPGDPDGIGAVRFENAYPGLRFRKPLWVDPLPDGSGRLVVVEQDGVVRAFPDRADASTSEVLLDWRARTYTRHNEEGLLGLAFHPEFAANGELFLHYSANNPRRGVVSRFRMDRRRQRILPRSEQVVLEQKQPWGNHNGGDLQFGPDGMLYITFGDGGAGGDPLNSGQDRSTWLGSILRIDVDRKRPYAVPKDNPFVGERSVRPEIWAYGLRNVWRMRFDPQTGLLWGGDVGQNRWEEIDILQPGGNHGWKPLEGSHPFRGTPPAEHVLPVVEHPTHEARSITGGLVYRGTRWPDLLGTYLYADYVTGNVWGLRHDGQQARGHRLLGRVPAVSSFGLDTRGEPLLVSHRGTLLRMVAGQAPTARFPRRLSETGIFRDLATLEPHASLIPYDVNVPLWSDGAHKQRYLHLPGTARIHVAADGRWTWPVGTFFVKTFFAGRDAAAPRLETRVFHKRATGWAGYTWRWNEAQTDAELLDARVTIPLPRSAQRAGLGAAWTFPSRSDCMACHTAAAGHVLGVRATQLMRPDGQDDLARLEGLGCFEGAAPRQGTPHPRWMDDPATPEQATHQVRSWLDANCAMCHQPGAPGNARIDLRHDLPLDAMRILEPPTQGDLGIRGAWIVKPGDPRRSTLWARMQRTDEQGMPNLSHHHVYRQAVERVGAWIRGLSRDR